MSQYPANYPSIDPPYLGVKEEDTKEAIRSLIGILEKFRERVSKTFNTKVVSTDGTQGMTAPFRLATFTVATRPTAASWTGAIIYVSDGGAGAVFQGSNGAAWVNLG